MKSQQRRGKKSSGSGGGNGGGSVLVDWAPRENDGVPDNSYTPSVQSTPAIQSSTMAEFLTRKAMSAFDSDSSDDDHRRYTRQRRRNSGHERNSENNSNPGEGSTGHGVMISNNRASRRGSGGIWNIISEAVGSQMGSRIADDDAAAAADIAGQGGGVIFEDDYDDDFSNDSGDIMILTDDEDPDYDGDNNDDDGDDSDDDIVMHEEGEAIVTSSNLEVFRSSSADRSSTSPNLVEEDEYMRLLDRNTGNKDEIHFTPPTTTSNDPKQRKEKKPQPTNDFDIRHDPKGKSLQPYRHPPDGSYQDAKSKEAKKKRPPRGGVRRGSKDDLDDGLHVGFPERHGSGDENDYQEKQQKQQHKSRQRNGQHHLTVHTLNKEQVLNKYKVDNGLDDDNDAVSESHYGYASTSGGEDDSSVRSSLTGLFEDDDATRNTNDWDLRDEDADEIDEDLALLRREQQEAEDGYFPISFLDPQSSLTTNFGCDGGSKKKTKKANSSPSNENVNFQYVDPVLVGNGLSKDETVRFSLEHRILLRAILQLLIESDCLGYGDESCDVNSQHNIIKKGSLKKFSPRNVRVSGRPIWKIKYVELRRGTFTYYEDIRKDGGAIGNNIGNIDNDMLHKSGRDGGRKNFNRNDSGQSKKDADGEIDDDDEERKTIQLSSGHCTCMAVDVKGTPGDGYVFELSVEGGPKRLWMTNSEEERQAWVRAINDAMIGSNPLSDMPAAASPSHFGTLDLTPHREAIEKYKTAQIGLSEAFNKKEYLSCLAFMWGKSLRVPVSWVRDHIGTTDGGPSALDNRLKRKNSSEAQSSGSKNIPISKVVKTRVAEFWKKLSRDTISINGFMVRGDSPHGPERIVGALTRCILEYHKYVVEQQGDSSSDVNNIMTELQAVKYARNVIMAYYTSRVRDESHFALDSMCRNANLVICLPSNTTSQQSPLHIHVFNATEDDILLQEQGQQDEQEHELIYGWVTTRSKSNKNWKNRYCVVSNDGVLSYYEHGSPRPHGLRGQLVLVNALLSQLPGQGTLKHLFILRIQTKENEKERQICFKDEKDFNLWREAIQRAIDLSTAKAAAAEVAGDGSPLRQMRKKNAGGKIKEGGVKIIKGAGDLVLRGMRGNKGGGDNANLPETAGGDGGGNRTILARRGKTLSTLFGATENMKTEKSTVNKREPTVQIVVESSSVYKVITADPCGDDERDTWAMVRANYLQSFFLSGGLQGRLTKGDEIVELEFLKGLVQDETFDLMFPRSEQD